MARYAKHLFAAVLILCCTLSLFSQIQFKNRVQTLELVPRNISTGLGTVLFDGTVPANKYNFFRVITYVDKVKKNDVTQSLSTSAGVTAFSYTNKIKAGKYHYDFELFFYGADTLTYRANNVVCGDVFLIQGQSNAVANSYVGLANPKYKDSFLRSFGTSSYNPADCAADTFWHIADGDYYYNAGCVGQWGLVLAKYILDSFQMPVAILNGAVGGTSVVYHQKDKFNPTNINLIYGRLLYRVQKAKLQNSIRTLFYFQGESDGTNPKLHDSLFRKLYADWNSDFKTIKKYYVVQVRGGGCGSPTAEFLEVQRQFEFTLKNCKVISSNGLNAHDGCHYGFVNGYQQLGNSLSPLLARDFYGKANLKNIDPPAIESAEYIQADFTKIAINMKIPTDSIFADPLFYKLFSVSGESGIYIVSGSVLNNKIVLDLNKGTCNPLFLTYMGQAGTQPWVFNKIKSGLIGFHLVPIKKKVPKLWYATCPNTRISIGEDSLAGYTYAWKLIGSNQTFTTTKFNYLVNNNLTFQLIMGNKLSACKYDTFTVNVAIDNTPKPYLGNDSTLCKGVTWKYTLNNLYKEINWKINSKASQDAQLQIDTNTFITLDVKTDLNCEYKDTVILHFSNPKINILAPTYICSNTDTLIYSKQNFPQYKWNDNAWGNSKELRTTPGLQRVLGRDSFGCICGDTITIQTFPPIKFQPIQLSICENDSVQIQIPNGLVSWRNTSAYLPQKYYFKPMAEKYFSALDSHSCSYEDSIRASILPAPTFTLGNDTSVCEGSKVKTICNKYADKYFWNNNPSWDNYFISTTETKIHCKITNPYNCQYEDSREIHYNALPQIKLPSDTTVCAEKELIFNSEKDQQWILDGKYYDTLKITAAGTYFVQIKNKEACISGKYIAVHWKNCNNQISAPEHTNITIYPNPTAGFLYFKASNEKLKNCIVFNAIGQPVESKNLSANSPYFIDISNIKPGIYFIHLFTEKQNFIQKIQIP